MATVVLGGNDQPNTFFTLLWLSMMLKLANFFKELLQGIFDKWGGVDEAKVADGMADSVSKVGVKFTNSTLDKFDKNRITFVGRTITNGMALSNAAKTGDISGFKNKYEAYKKFGSDLKKEGLDDWKDLNAKVGSSAFKSLIESEGDGKQMHEMYMKGVTIDGKTYRPLFTMTEGTDEYNELMAKANELAARSEVGNEVKSTYDAMIKAKKTERLGKDIASGAGKDYKNTDPSKILASAIESRRQASLETMYGSKPIAEMSSYASTANGATPVASEARGASAFKSQPLFSSERIRKALQDSGKPVTPTAMAEEQSIIQQRVNEKFLDVDKAIKRQNEAGKDTSISDNIRDRHTNATNQSVRECVNHMTQLYKDGYLAQSPQNDEMIRKLEKYVDKVEKNADFDLYKDLDAKVKEMKSTK